MLKALLPESKLGLMTLALISQCRSYLGAAGICEERANCFYKGKPWQQESGA
jgi:hypothetical protein